jgi:hypothetical protein
MNRTRWEYCLLTCAPASGLDDDGYRAVCQVVRGDQVESLDIRTGPRSPLAAIGQLLDRLGLEGWELVAYDTSTNRGVLKRPVVELGES